MIKNKPLTIKNNLSNQKFTMGGRKSVCLNPAKSFVLRNLSFFTYNNPAIKQATPSKNINMPEPN